MVGRQGAHLHLVSPSTMVNKHVQRDAPWCVRSASPPFKIHLAVRSMPLKEAHNARYPLPRPRNYLAKQDFYLAEGGKLVACRLRRRIRFATLTSGGRTPWDGFHPLCQAERLIPLMCTIPLSTQACEMTRHSHNLLSTLLSLVI